MSLYSDWIDLMEGQTDETFQEFWDEYATTEKKIYEYILENKEEHLKGTYSQLVEKFEANPTIFMGFVDGINSSLKKEHSLEEIQPDTFLEFCVDFDKLFYNMLKADADYLYNLPQWSGILSDERQVEILKDYRRSKIVRKEKEPGRNDPCPCGSGKKYKKCCGNK